MGIQVEGVGHVVLKVSDVERSLAFYRDALGLKEVARMDAGLGPMVFLSTGHNHHDIALLEVGSGGRRPKREDVGLFHVALKIGNDLDTLRAAKVELEKHNVPIKFVMDHRVSQSIYTADPDGNQVELFVDADPAIWRDKPALVATADSLTL
jgi:catechol 2,3-dioxygenase